MAKEDLFLPVEMERLEIQPTKIPKKIDENPFNLTQRKNMYSRTCQQNLKCLCVVQKKIKNVPISKKKTNKILKEPVLKLLQSCKREPNDVDTNSNILTQFSPVHIQSDTLNLCALVDNCNQLKISQDLSKNNVKFTDPRIATKRRKSESLHERRRETISERNQSGTCSQQALNPPCDVTIDELASYFETLVHIPKKMSSMAEMMYI